MSNCSPGSISTRNSIRPATFAAMQRPLCSTSAFFVHGGNAGPFSNQPRQIERVSSRDERPFAIRFAVAQVAQAANGGLDSELLAANASNKSATADLAPQFHPPQHASQFPPGRRGWLTQ